MSVVGAAIASGILGGASQWLTNRKNESLQREAWEREDTAMQRRVADLKAAGLSPVLAAGQGASSMSPIQVGNPGEEARQGLESAVALMSAKTGIRKTEAETDAAYQQARVAEQEWKFRERTFTDRVAKAAEEAAIAEQQSRKVQAQSETAWVNNLFNMWKHGMDPTVKGFRLPVEGSPAAREFLAGLSEKEQRAAFQKVVTRLMALTGSMPGQKQGFDLKVGRFGISGSMSSQVQALLKGLLQKAFGLSGTEF